jgi:hypothetical protein
MRSHTLATLAAATLTALAGVARADGTPIRAPLIDAKTIKFDGIPKEWGALMNLGHTVKGRAGSPDLEAKAVLTYDATNLYVAADVTDDVLRAGADHVELLIGFPGGSTHEVRLYPGQPGKSAGFAKNKDGSMVAGARVVEAPRDGGWMIEASVPWSAFPQARLLRVGLRGGIFVHDADASQAIESIVGTASSTAYAKLPAISTEPELALADGLLRDKGIRTAPRCNLVADVAGDAMKERVLVFDRYLVVLGPGYRKGSEYFFTDLAGDVVSCDVRDVTGDGHSEIVLKKRVGVPSKPRDVLQIQSFGAAEVPSPVFEHEIGITTEGGSVQNELTFVPDGGKIAIRVTPGTAKGLSAATYREPTETSWDPLLLPWGTIASQTYKFSGGRFTKSSEERKEGSAAPPPAAARTSNEPASRAPPPPNAAEVLDRVYETYKRDRGASGRARFDFTADVAADGKSERVLVHDRDIVVLGRGFKGGTGYGYLTLTLFASGNDIQEVTARDLNGDGKAEIIVKGVQHANAPSGETVDREILLVFTLAGDTLKRVFAAEIGRSIGRKRVSAAVSFVNTTRGFDIQLGPGRATEWNEKTYPFGQDNGAAGGLEPLLLPWSNAAPVRYRWNGSAFVR